jgi:hypothetical protein
MLENFIKNLILVKNKMRMQEEPSLKVNLPPKQSNFSKDKETAKKKRFTDSPGGNGKVRPSGVGPEYDTRHQGSVYAMSGLGDVTYRESMDPNIDKYSKGTTERTGKSFTEFRKVLESIDDPGASDMGVYGVSGGSTNKEPMQTYRDQDRIGISKTYKKKNGKLGEINVHKK